MDQSSIIRIHTFPPGFGLPTTGPFSLKLAMALRMADIPYEWVVDDLSKSPKRKIPWIEHAGVTMADSALILHWLARTRGVDLERGLDPIQRAQGLALRVLLEEHWHQVFEYELILHPDGVGKRLGPAMQEHFQRHLFERGMCRHTPDEITELGKADLDAVATWLEGREWIFGERPTLTDCSLWGLLAPSIFSPLPTPCMSYARTLSPIVSHVERARARFFPEIAPPAPGKASSPAS
jgi:glutathione S-transferase